MSTRTGIIYMCELDENPRQRYIGKTVQTLDERKQQHLNADDNTMFHMALQLATKADWRELEPDVPEERLSEREVWWIALLDTHANGLNSTEGGEGGSRQTPEERIQAVIDELSENDASLKKRLVQMNVNIENIPRWEPVPMSVEYLELKAQHAELCAELLNEWTDIREILQDQVDMWFEKPILVDKPSGTKYFNKEPVYKERKHAKRVSRPEQANAYAKLAVEIGEKSVKLLETLMAYAKEDSHD